MKTNQDHNAKNYAVTFIAYAFLCFITSFFFYVGYRYADEYEGWQQLSYQGGTYGPIKITEENTIFTLLVSKALSYGNWEYITVEVLDKNQEYLFSFGKEFWSESGYDSGGSWYESDNELEFTVTIEEQGEYYFKITPENDSRLENVALHVQSRIKFGSHLPFIWTGIISLAFGFFIQWQDKEIPANSNIVSFCLTMLYMFLFLMSLYGLGYIGYSRPSVRNWPSSFQRDDITIYGEEPSLRSDSHRGGGIHGGK